MKQINLVNDTESIYEARLTTASFIVREKSLAWRGGQIKSSDALATVARGYYRELDADREHFSIFALDNKLRLIGVKVVSSGTVSYVDANPREVMRAALIFGAVSFCVVHNHPSGDSAPSSDDITVTRRLREAGDLLGVALNDHLILGNEGRYFSFRDKGTL